MPQLISRVYRSPRGRPPPPQTESSVKSAWASPRPVTPPARGRQGRPQTAGSVYPQEGLDELGSTFLKYPGVLPSFMRPTAAHERRLNAAGEDSRESARTPSPPRRQARSVNPTARFIQPTASYSAKATTPVHVASTPIGRPRTPMVRAHSAAPVCARLLCLYFGSRHGSSWLVPLCDLSHHAARRAACAELQVYTVSQVHFK